MKKLLLPILALAAVVTSATAQTRYHDAVFTSAEITVGQDIVYGHNMEILTGSPVLKDLQMDLYQPDPIVDVEAKRPLVIVLHTGNFLPPVINGSASGQRKDKSVISSCTTLARSGYVAAAVSYRLGWNPISTDQEVRVGTLLQAVYRAVLDAKTAIRYFKEDAATINQFRVDTNNIVLMGIGTGGYISLATAFLSDQSEIELSKFINTLNNPPLFIPGQSYVIPAMLGNFDGSGGNAAFNNYEYPNHSNDFKMAVNVGGALADTSWMNAGEPAVASVQCVRDPFAPFIEATVYVPGATPLPVVDVQGANIVIDKANQLGLNDKFKDVAFFGDPYTTAARAMYGVNTPYIYPAPLNSVDITTNGEGLLAILRPDRTNINVFANESSPWDWWDINELTAMVAYINATQGTSYDAATIDAQGKLSNPDMSQAKSDLYIDTIMGFIRPRIMRQLELPGHVELATNEVVKSASGMNVYPNPASQAISITVEGSAIIKQVEIIDITGRIASIQTIATGNQANVSLETLHSGVYIVKAITNEGTFTQRIVKQ